MEIVRLEKLSKAYEEQSVLDNVNFSLKSGEIVGLVGKNGSGKTTLMKIILGLAKPTSGRIKIKEGTSFGFLLDCKLFENLTAEENISVIETYKEKIDQCKKREIRQILEFVGLGKNKKKVKSYSFGMKQRLGLALALLNKPDVLILDEPFVGLDPIGKEAFVRYIEYIKKEWATTIFISSHQLDEISRLCNKVLLIQNRKIKELDLDVNDQVVFEVEAEPSLIKRLFKADQLEALNKIVVRNNSDELNDLLETLIREKIHVRRVSCINKVQKVSDEIAKEG